LTLKYRQGVCHAASSIGLRLFRPCVHVNSDGLALSPPGDLSANIAFSAKALLSFILKFPLPVRPPPVPAG
jgi:hypothetical protein